MKDIPDFVWVTVEKCNWRSASGGRGRIPNLCLSLIGCATYHCDPRLFRFVLLVHAHLTLTLTCQVYVLIRLRVRVRVTISATVAPRVRAREWEAQRATGRGRPNLLELSIVILGIH